MAVAFIGSNEFDPHPSRIVFALQVVARDLAIVTIDRDADVNLVNGLAEAAALLAVQLVYRLDGTTFAERAAP